MPTATEQKPSDKLIKALKQILSVPKKEFDRRGLAYKQQRKIKSHHRHRYDDFRLGQPPVLPKVPDISGRGSSNSTTTTIALATFRWLAACFAPMSINTLNAI
jgi:hypothetical protein